MKSSILRNILIAFMSLGVLVGMIFPFFASIFVEFKEGLYGWFVVGCLIAGGIIGLCNYAILNFLLIQKLKSIATVSNAISQRDLTHSCSIKSHDVIGEIIDGFNNMASTLHNVISELKSSIVAMKEGTQKINTIANETQAGIIQQNQQTENIETSISQMTTTAQEVSAKAAQAAEAASLAKKEAEKGTQVVTQNMQSIKSLASDVENAAGSIHRVEAESNNIGGVLDVIQSISEQTNLLALNAAIEAARAGEQGRGFAVVADEVRTLAQRTQESTKEIQTMIDNLQSVSRETVEIMDKSQNQASDSVKQAAEAGSSLQEINNAVTAITEMNTLIDNEAGSQSDIALEVNRNMEVISQITGVSKNGAERTVKESENLTNLASQLELLVGKFKL